MTATRPVGALSLILLLAAAPGLAAQEDDGGERPGWIGVGIQESLDCGSRTDGAEAPEAVALVEVQECRRVLVTEAVFEDTPAARAGMQVGDTLIAVNGQPLSERRGARALGSLTPGQPVEVLLGRESGRTSLQITPEPRPPEKGPAPVFVPGSRSLVIDAGSLERLRRMGRAGEATEVRFQVDDGEIAGVLKVDEEGRVYLEKAPHKLIPIKGAELPPPKVRALRDSAMAEAREQLKKVREQFQARVAEAPAWDADGERIRMLGAEFLALTDELAGNLRGVEAGLLVLRVVPGTPAAQMGLRPGDVVVEAGGRSVAGAADLRAPFTEVTPGDSVVVRWVRRGEEMRGALERR